jgi:hypothetical protein
MQQTVWKAKSLLCQIYSIQALFICLYGKVFSFQKKQDAAEWN